MNLKYRAINTARQAPPGGELNWENLKIGKIRGRFLVPLAAPLLSLDNAPWGTLSRISNLFLTLTKITYDPSLLQLPRKEKSKSVFISVSFSPKFGSLLSCLCIELLSIFFLGGGLFFCNGFRHKPASLTLHSYL